MEQEKRPGGLTALAVFNFIFAGFGVIAFMGFVVMLGFMDKLPTDEMEPVQRARIEALD